MSHDEKYPPQLAELDAPISRILRTTPGSFEKTEWILDNTPEEIAAAHVAAITTGPKVGQ